MTLLSSARLPARVLVLDEDWQGVQAGFIAAASAGSLLLAILHSTLSILALFWRGIGQRPETERPTR